MSSGDIVPSSTIISNPINRCQNSLLKLNEFRFEQFKLKPHGPVLIPEQEFFVLEGQLLIG